MKRTTLSLLVLVLVLGFAGTFQAQTQAPPPMPAPTFEQRLAARAVENRARRHIRERRPLEARMDERFGTVETEVRHTRILVEGMDDKIRLLAEGVVGTSERIDSLREETTGRLEEIKGSVDMVHKILVPRVQRLENRVKILDQS